MEMRAAGLSLRAISAVSPAKRAAVAVLDGPVDNYGAPECWQRRFLGGMKVS